MSADQRLRQWLWAIQTPRPAPAACRSLSHRVSPLRLAGSFCFGDADYGKNVSKDGGVGEWQQSLWVLATVVSRNVSRKSAVLDAGTKVVSETSRFACESCGICFFGLISLGLLLAMVLLDCRPSASTRVRPSCRRDKQME